MYDHRLTPYIEYEEGIISLIFSFGFDATEIRSGNSDVPILLDGSKKGGVIAQAHNHSPDIRLQFVDACLSMCVRWPCPNVVLFGV